MIIVITGTHKGIGYHIARHYIQEGHTVIGCSRHESEFEHNCYQHFIVDIRDEKQVDDFAKQIRKKYGKIDALINNAGIAAMNHFMMTPIDTVRKLMEVNYLGSLACIRAFVSMLKKSDHPRVVNFSTVAVPFFLEGEMAYSCSKAAVESMTKVLAKELSGFHITLNAVGPTPVRTDLTAKVPEEKLNKILDLQAIHRFCECNDIINVIDFYLKPESDFITGQVIYLGGVFR